MNVFLNQKWTKGMFSSLGRRQAASIKIGRRQADAIKIGCWRWRNTVYSRESRISWLFSYLFREISAKTKLSNIFRIIFEYGKKFVLSFAKHENPENPVFRIALIWILKWNVASKCFNYISCVLIFEKIEILLKFSIKPSCQTPFKH